MDDDMTLDLSEEMEEVAELPESSEETQEVAEPVEESTVNEEPSRRTDSDAAFAEMRRENQRLQKEHSQMMAALGRYFKGENATDLALEAQAYADDRNVDDVRAEYERDEEFENLRAENEEMRQTLLDLQVQQLMKEGLQEIQQINPNVKSLDELGETFANMIGAGLSTKEAYYATMVMEQKEKVMPPDAIGKISDTKVERDYYTSEELDNLTDEEMDANWDKVMKSLQKL